MEWTWKNYHVLSLFLTFHKDRVKAVDDHTGSKTKGEEPRKKRRWKKTVCLTDRVYSDPWCPFISAIENDEVDELISHQTDTSHTTDRQHAPTCDHIVMTGCLALRFCRFQLPWLWASGRRPKGLSCCWMMSSFLSFFFFLALLPVLFYRLKAIRPYACLQAYIRILRVGLSYKRCNLNFPSSLEKNKNFKPSYKTLRMFADLMMSFFNWATSIAFLIGLYSFLFFRFVISHECFYYFDHWEHLDVSLIICLNLITLNVIWQLIARIIVMTTNSLVLHVRFIIGLKKFYCKSNEVTFLKNLL